MIKILTEKKKSELIALIGVAVSAVLAVVNVARFAAIGEPAPFIVVLALSCFLLLAALAAYRTRVSLLWLALGAGCVVLHCCSNYGSKIANAVYVIWAAAALVCGAAVIVFKILEKSWLPRPAYICVAVWVIVAALCGAFWGGSVASVRNKTASAQTEVWAVPTIYDGTECAQPGRVEKFFYGTKAYATDGRAVVKRAYAYLPYGYDEEKKYDVLYLMHGTGDDEAYWLVDHAYNKTMLDNLIYRGDIRPVIVITPTWYVENDCADDPDKLTYTFVEELRNDIVPFVENKYSTYAENTEKEGLVASRRHRAFAGLSRGAATTYRTAFCKSLDYFSRFGAFSGCMTTEEEFASVRSGPFDDYEIDYLYNTSGTFDFLLSEHSEKFRALLEAESRLTLNVNCSFDVMPMAYHSINSWHIALYNCLQKFYSV